MKLIDALSVLRRPSPPDALPFRVHLACGFTPLDLKTFLAAHLRVGLQERPVESSLDCTAILRAAWNG